jgi:predicted DNA-binding transcriptional regulator AlpA
LALFSRRLLRNYSNGKILEIKVGQEEKDQQLKPIEKKGEKMKQDEQSVLRKRPPVKTRQAALEAGLSASFLYHNWQHIPAARRAGNALRWDVDELLEWMKQQAQAS